MDDIHGSTLTPAQKQWLYCYHCFHPHPANQPHHRRRPAKAIFSAVGFGHNPQRIFAERAFLSLRVPSRPCRHRLALGVGLSQSCLGACANVAQAEIPIWPPILDSVDTVNADIPLLRLS